ncbi:signal peptide-containing protein, putative [Babesia ovata]|uniref:Signal peptide-containing protein, putative n=1 Tax=Babesia ovata TaxID=189622 RepID=A0A2H6K835_9APIC|nr:signal peptide-containing protein, putative [Babesia ovata]GBE59155.1 signal peptide-containing protein, putative [Babesia ovata]
MSMAWVWLMMGVAIVVNAFSQTAGSNDVENYRVCLPLNLNEDTCPLDVTKDLRKDGHWYSVINQFTNVLGDITFGDRVVKGDCHYTLRDVYENINETGRKVVKVRTLHTGNTIELEEYVETEPDSATYVELQRKSVDLDMNAMELPNYVYPLYNTSTRSTDIDIHPTYRNTYRIGKVTIAQHVVPDMPCIGRSVTIWERRDGRRIADVATVHSDETITNDTFIEQSAVMANFVPYDPSNGTEDIRIGLVEDDLDFDIHP